MKRRHLEAASKSALLAPLVSAYLLDQRASTKETLKENAAAIKEAEKKYKVLNSDYVDLKHMINKQRTYAEEIEAYKEQVAELQQDVDTYKRKYRNCKKGLRNASASIAQLSLIHI